MDLAFVIASVAVFTGVVLILVFALEAVSKKLSPGGSVKIDINNGSKVLEVSPGSFLLSALANEKLFLPSACGGGGTCAMCKCVITEGGGDILPTETGHIKKAEAKEGVRLACQVKVKENMKIEVPPEVMEIQKFEATVNSNENVATFIKELDMTLPEGVDLNFKSGGYIQIDIPKYDLSFRDFNIEKEYQEDWDKFNLWDLRAKNDDPCFRAYSMANHPAEGNRVTLNVRIATPPPKTDYPPGIASSYIFNLKPGDKVMLSGPFGEFFIKDTDREMVYIGGGAGMAPLRSHLFHLFHTLKTGRKVSFWYGARSKREMFYDDEFKAIEKEFPNFSYNVALSDPLPEDNWDGYVGFIHQVVLDQYLNNHEDPTEIEYYMCGPPMMLSAVRKMLYDLGVESDMIAYDEF
jgi:Na+-transporting NADH:ubiquinone oxidoreductase subunit F